MPTPTYTPLANVTLSSNAASVTFSSISQLYKDLVVIVSASVTDNNYGYPIVQANSDTSVNSYWYVEGFGQGTSSYAGGSQGYGVVAIAGGSAPMSTTARAIVTYNIMNYSSTDKQKAFLTKVSSPTILSGVSSTRWIGTSAITSLVFAPGNGSATGGAFASGSTFAIYGIAA